MASVVSSTKDLTEVLLVWPKSIAEKIQFTFTLMFVNLIALNRYVSGKIKTNDKFVVVIPGDDLENFLNDPVCQFSQVQLIYAYYDDSNLLKEHENLFKYEYPKLRFYHERDLPVQLDKVKIDNAIRTSNPTDTTTIKSCASTIAQRISAKRSRTARRHSSASKRFASTPKHGFPVRNIQQMDQKYICPSCELVFRDPFQLNCGHRICESCINVENSDITCKNCADVSSNENSWCDQGFQNELQQLPISCPDCVWVDSLKYYQEHIDKHYANREHDIGTIDVYTQQVNQNVSVNKPERRQQILSNIRSSSQSSELGQRPLQAVVSNFFSLQTSQEENVNHVNGLMNNRDLRDREVSTLRRMTEDGVLTTGDGTFIWRIPGIKEKIADAQSERQKSIYSPPFYSSPAGYKICLRLYLNGDGDSRDTYLSLFFVIMRGDHDAILQWPFAYKVKLCLIDQSTLGDNPRHITDAFWPDLSANCFLRPHSSMNGAYGFKTFFSLEQLEKFANLYIQDDTIFIKIEIDFLTARPALLAPSSSVGLPNDDEHVGALLFVAVIKHGQNHYTDAFYADTISNSFQKPPAEMAVASGISKNFSLPGNEQEGNLHVPEDTMFIKIKIDLIKHEDHFNHIHQEISQLSLVSMHPLLEASVIQQLLTSTTSSQGVPTEDNDE